MAYNLQERACSSEKICQIGEVAENDLAFGFISTKLFDHSFDKYDALW